MSATCSDEHSVAEAFTNTQRELGPEIHVLVNNAGLGIMGDVDGFTTEDWKLMFDTNVLGHLLLHPRRAAADEAPAAGHIVNVACWPARRASASMAGYCATKFAVRGFSDSLFKEVRPAGIRVTCVMPGSVETNFNGNESGRQPNPHKMQPEAIADAIVHAIEAPFDIDDDFGDSIAAGCNVK